MSPLDRTALRPLCTKSLAAPARLGSHPPVFADSPEALGDFTTTFLTFPAFLTDPLLSVFHLTYYLPLEVYDDAPATLLQADHHCDSASIGITPDIMISMSIVLGTGTGPHLIAMKSLSIDWHQDIELGTIPHLPSAARQRLTIVGILPPSYESVTNKYVSPSLSSIR